MFRVLIVDDDVFVHKCLEKLIPWEKLGYRVVGNAFDGEQAYSIALKTDPDVIISDVMMPGMDGGELLKRLSGIYTNVVFIFLSGYEDFKTAQIALKYAANDYILKPVDSEKIRYLTKRLENIHKELGMKRSYQQYLHSAYEENNIRSALDRRDVSFFREMFGKISMDISETNANRVTIHELAVRLYIILLEYQRVELNERQQRLEKLAELKTWFDVIFFVSEAYFECLRLPNDYNAGLADQILAYINQKYSDPQLSVAGIAQHFSYSPDWLNRLFSRMKDGITISQYIQTKRMEIAAGMLRMEARPVDEIALNVGYTSNASFSRAFKKQYGIAPTMYRAGGGKGAEG